MHSSNSNSTLSSSCWKVFLIYARCMIYLSCLFINEGWFEFEFQLMDCLKEIFSSLFSEISQAVSNSHFNDFSCNLRITFIFIDVLKGKLESTWRLGCVAQTLISDK